MGVLRPRQLPTDPAEHNVVGPTDLSTDCVNSATSLVPCG